MAAFEVRWAAARPREVTLVVSVSGPVRVQEGQVPLSGAHVARMAALLIDRVTQPLALCAPCGRLLHANGAFERNVEDRELILEAVARVTRSASTKSDTGVSPCDSVDGEATVGRWRVVAHRLDWGVDEQPPPLLVALMPRTSIARGRDVLPEHYRFTRRELEVLSLLRQRRSNAEIADALGISAHTARHHTESVLQKLGVHSRTQVEGCLTAMENGATTLTTKR